MSKEFQLSVNARALIRAFESAPIQTRNMVRTQLKIAVEQIRDYASDHHRYTTRTGNLERNGVSTSVTDNVGKLWVDTEKVSYAGYIHEGHGKITIAPRNTESLKWGQRPSNNTIFVSAWKPDPFLYNAVDSEREDIQKNFAVALQNLLEGL